MILNIFILLLSLVMIVWGANNLVSGSVSLAHRFQLSDFFIGAIIVGIGTSFPELIVSSYGAWQGNSDIAIGNVVGSNIFNTWAILGATALIFPVTVTSSNIRFELPFCIIISLIALLLAFDFFSGGPISISQIDGLIFLALFVLFIFLSYLENKKHHYYFEQIEVSVRHPLWAMGQAVLGLGILAVSCHYFVDAAANIALRLGADEAFISITLIACGTSLPELAASMAAAFKKNTQLALGNIVGSNIFNITFILGLSSQISTLSGGGITLIDFGVMSAAALFPVFLCRKGRIGRFSGGIMFLSFIIYISYLWHQQTN